MPTFSSLLLDHTKVYESPTSFWEWSAYTTIAAILRDNCYRKQGDSKLYPNVYTLLLADSGGRKDKPIKLCESLVKHANNTKVISGRTSIQAILDELNHVSTDPKDASIKNGGSGILIAPELAAALVEDSQSIAIMTDIYDLKENYDERLRGRPGKLSIDKVVFSMFAGSNSDMLQNSVFNKTAVQGGLLARTFLICPNEFRPANSLLRLPPMEESFKQLITFAKDLARLNGEFKFNDASIDEYDLWYKPFREEQLVKPDKSGVLGRLHTGILKVSMLLAANELSLDVTKHHVEQAIEKCMNLIPNYNAFVMVSGKSDISECGALVLQDLMRAENHVISRKELLRAHWSQFNSEILDKFVVTVEQAGLLQIIANGSNLFYKLTPKCLETMMGVKDVAKDKVGK